MDGGTTLLEEIAPTWPRGGDLSRRSMEMSTPANSTNLAILGLHPSAYKVRRTPVIKTKWDIDGARGSERMWGQQTHGSWVTQWTLVHFNAQWTLVHFKCTMDSGTLQVHNGLWYTSIAQWTLVHFKCTMDSGTLQVISRDLHPEAMKTVFTRTSRTCHHINLPSLWIGRIVTEDLKLKKTPAKFIPRFLTNEQKLCRLATCEDMMEMTRTDPEWKDKIITGDETWVYGYDPETKPQSAEWRG
ncbi:hypothetical protein LAZ67_1007205 [Cordylochernes scorpioides]|uniref:Uncharacterized protein n=1 Tax=Cordylochernes scorpioides TaxID=51811 RepID=A0ABY6JZ48_9ARAC|nr:hypothetical protein LAZ67_1007205 [Cordylochernes scorpioides]